jgi:membrane fusion protein (multidrug efflux system)
VADAQTQIPASTAIPATPAPASGRLVWPGALLVAAVVYFGLNYLGVALTHESTDDAFIAGHVVSVAPRVAGQIAAVRVRDNELVHSNELLVEIDPADLTMTSAQKSAAADAEAANYQAILAGLELMNTKLVTAAATARESHADADALVATTDRARADLSRAGELIGQKTISPQEFDAAQATEKQAEANLNSARQKAEADDSRIKEANAEYIATKSAVVMALAKMRQAQTDLDAARLNLSYTKIFAPADGRVTRKSVEPGDYVEAGQALLAIVPTEVWVVANFKESQLRKMKPGLPVRVEIDALGGRSFAAHVDSIQAGSGAQFSLLPPENATGNFVKVVQRVPVKIVFEEPLPADHTIGPGLSVTPVVAVGGWVAPKWLTALAAVAAGTLAFLIFSLLSRRRNAGK